MPTNSLSIDDGLLPDDELLRLHSSAQELIDRHLVDLASGRLLAATPCSMWNLGALLAHLLGQNRGLTSAVRGGGQEWSAWAPVVVAHPGKAIAESARDLVRAFADRGVRGEVWMPEISPVAPLPIRTALLAHLVDTVVHGWDVAVSLGQTYDVPDDVLAAAAAIAERVPDGDSRKRPGAAFGPAIAETGGRLTILLAPLGRDPGWTQLTAQPALD